jgi:hypothetical protein
MCQTSSNQWSVLLRCPPPVFDRAADSDELIVRLPLRTRAELEERARQYDVAPGDLVTIMLQVLGPWLEAETCPLCALRETTRRGQPPAA